MNVLILGPREPIPPIKGGAIEKLTLELAKALKKYGIAEEVVLLATTYSENLLRKQVCLDGVRILYVSTPIRGPMFYFTKMPLVSSRMKRIYERIKGVEGGDWVIHSVYFYNLISFSKVKDSIFISEFEHYPWVAEYLYYNPNLLSTFERMRWELDAKLRIELARYITKKAEIVHAVSKFQAEQMRKQVPEISRRLVIIPNFVNTEMYKPQEAHEIRRKLIGDKEMLAGFIGRLTPHKNLHLLLMAMARVRRSLLRKLRLVVIGPQAPGFYYITHHRGCSYRYLKFIHHLIEKYNLRDSVIFTGTVKEEDLPYYISSLDFLVHPSFVEAFGLVLLEAMACGKPVIIFNVPPLNEIVNKNVGLMANISIKDFASKIELMMCDEKLRKLLASNAITYVREVYHVKKVIEFFRRTYMSLPP